MADQNDQLNTPQSIHSAPVTTPIPTETQKVEFAVEKGFTVIIKDLWNKYGIFFIIIGAGLVILKFNDIIMDILGWSSKKDLQEAQKEDSKLQAKEDAANKQADALVQEANELPNKEGTVDDNWDKENK